MKGKPNQCFPLHLYLLSTEFYESWFLFQKPSFFDIHETCFVSIYTQKNQDYKLP